MLVGLLCVPVCSAKLIGSLPSNGSCQSLLSSFSDCCHQGVGLSPLYLHSRLWCTTLGLASLFLWIFNRISLRRSITRKGPSQGLLNLGDLPFVLFGL